MNRKNEYYAKVSPKKARYPKFRYKNNIIIVQKVYV